jgi:seryl-tRNA synthetase
MSHSAQNGIESIADTLLQATSVAGVHARTALFDRVIESLSSLITRHREPDTEVLRFPPIMSRAQLQRSGYLHSFPHLLGCVSCLNGDEADIHTLVDGRDPERDWIDGLSATGLVLTPAACYPLYPLVATRGRVPSEGLKFDVASYCFRRERSFEIDRLQAFQMREWVFVGTAEQALDFRSRLRSWAEELAGRLALPFTVAPASDPFFGRAGKLMAMNQLEQSLKFELLIPVHSEELPTACMSFNYHRDHFGTTWDLTTGAGEIAHTACVAFGLERFALALFAVHGLDLERWPAIVREILCLDQSSRAISEPATHKNGAAPRVAITLAE